MITTPFTPRSGAPPRSEEHTSELQSRLHLVCRLLLEKKKIQAPQPTTLKNSPRRIRPHRTVCPMRANDPQEHANTRSGNPTTRPSTVLASRPVWHRDP